MSDRKKIKTGAVIAIVASIFAAVILMAAVLGLILSGLENLTENRDLRRPDDTYATPTPRPWEVTPPPITGTTPPPMGAIPPPLVPPPPMPDHLILEVEGTIDAFLFRGGWIYYCRAENSEVIVGRVAPDGRDEIIMQQRWPWGWPLILAFHITEDGDMFFFLENWGDFDWNMFEDWDWDEDDWSEWDAFWDDIDWDRDSFFYITYENATGALTYVELTETLAIEGGEWLSRVFFDEAGNFALNVHSRDHTTIHIFANDGSHRGTLEIEEWIEFAQTGDGRVIVATEDWATGWTFRELDLNRGQWGETFPLLQLRSGIWLREVLSATPDSPFDLYLDTRSGGGPGTLYGYILETGEITHLFNWEDTETDFHAWTAGILPGGRLLTYSWDTDGDRSWTELRIQTP